MSTRTLNDAKTVVRNHWQGKGLKFNDASPVTTTTTATVLVEEQQLAEEDTRPAGHTAQTRIIAGDVTATNRRVNCIANTGMIVRVSGITFGSQTFKPDLGNPGYQTGHGEVVVEGGKVSAQMDAFNTIVQTGMILELGPIAMEAQRAPTRMAECHAAEKVTDQ